MSGWNWEWLLVSSKEIVNTTEKGLLLNWRQRSLKKAVTDKKVAWMCYESNKNMFTVYDGCIWFHWGLVLLWIMVCSQAIMILLTSWAKKCDRNPFHFLCSLRLISINFTKFSAPKWLLRFHFSPARKCSCARRKCLNCNPLGYKSVGVLT